MRWYGRHFHHSAQKLDWAARPVVEIKIEARRFGSGVCGRVMRTSRDRPWVEAAFLRVEAHFARKFVSRDSRLLFRCNYFEFLAHPVVGGTLKDCTDDVCKKGAPHSDACHLVLHGRTGLLVTFRDIVRMTSIDATSTKLGGVTAR